MMDISEKATFITIVMAVLLVIFALTFSVQKAKADGTIYIRLDGSVDPATAPISSLDNITYYFTNDIYDSIVVEKDNVVVDGTGYTIQGAGSGTGFDLSDRTNVTVRNTEIRAFDYGIYFYYSSHNTIHGNNIEGTNIAMYLFNCSSNWIYGNNMMGNGDGVWLRHSSDNSISGNNIASNWGGILLFYSSNNTSSENNITNNRYGFRIGDSSNNSVYNNNIIDNMDQVDSTDSANSWNNSYPCGGNYWSDCHSQDMNKGPDQNVVGSDGAGDMPYTIDSSNRDNFPLMGRFSAFQVTSEHNVQTVCNSTISNLQFNGEAIFFNVSGEDDTVGFCRIHIPIAVMNGTFKVFVDGVETSHTLLGYDNSMSSYIYFTYNHSTREVLIVPEISSLLIPCIFAIATLFMVTIECFLRKAR